MPQTQEDQLTWRRAVAAGVALVLWPAHLAARAWVNLRFFRLAGGFAQRGRMTQSVPASLPRRSHVRERLGLAMLMALPVGLLVAGAAVLQHYTDRDWDETNAAADRELAEAVAEADRLDPGWRLEELTAKRKNLPDDQNAAVRVVAAKKLLPSPWPPPSSEHNPVDPEEFVRGMAPASLDEAIAEQPPPIQLGRNRTKELRGQLDQAAKALTEARKLVDLQEGRYALTFKPDFYSTLLPTQQDARLIAQLLILDATLRAQDGDVDAALTSICAALNVARSIGDEPLAVSQLIRLACRTSAVTSLERVLAQGAPSEKALAAVQQVLIEEDAHPWLLVAARGERAGVNRLMEALESGEVPTEQIREFATSGRSGWEEIRSELALDPAAIRSAHAWMLRWLNEYVEVAKLPPWERKERLAKLEQAVKADTPPLARLLIPGVVKLADADQKGQGQLRCALAALAIERYRRERRQWPSALIELETKQLTTIPLDPYDGQPLRFLRLHGLPSDAVVYSVGPDGEDNHGHLDRKQPDASGTDVGFRLWDPSMRRQRPR